MICSQGCRQRDARRAPTRSRAGVAALAVLVAITPAASAALRVVATTPSLADIARNIGGRFVKVESVMRGPENIHNVKARPSHMIKLRKADLFIHSGLDGELWAPNLIKGSRNRKLRPGQPGNVNVSRGIKLKEVPARGGGASRALGDIHVFGNTHYSLDPLNGVIIARTIANAFKKADPKHAEVFEKNYQSYAKTLREMTKRLQAQLAPYRGTPIVVYHRMWPYFRDRFGIVKAAEVEPKPGITPGPNHLAECVDTMKEKDVRIVIVETFNSKKNAETVAQRAGGKAIVMSQEVNAIKGVDTYQKMFEYNVNKLIEAFKEVGIEPRASAAATDGHAAGGATP